MFNEYLRGNSVIHRIDPRIKIIYAFLFSLVIALQKELVPALMGFLIGASLVSFAKIKIRELIRRLLVIDEFLLLLWIILPFSYSKEPVLRIWNLRLSYEGVLFTLLLTIKANGIMLILTGLLATSSILNIVHGLLHLKIPEKFVFIFFLLYRYIWVLYDEYERIMRAIKARGFRFRSSLHTYRTVAYIVGGLLVKSYNRADNLYRAMVSRGFNGRFWRLEHFKFSSSDCWVVILLTFGNLLIVIF